MGVTFIAHGWEKFTTIAAITVFFKSADIAQPRVATVAAAAVELAGGEALMLGLLLSVLGTLLGPNMPAAIAFVHGRKGPFIANDGFELVLRLAAARIAIAFSDRASSPPTDCGRVATLSEDTPCVGQPHAAIGDSARAAARYR